MVQSEMENMERSFNNSSSSSTVLMRTVLTTCPSCGSRINYEPRPQGGGGGGDGDGGRGAPAAVEELAGLPAGLKFDPTDQELLEHLESKSRADPLRLHHLIDEFIPTIEGENGICYTHPKKLPGVREDGVVRHFFHRPSRAYTTGTRKRRKVVVESTLSEAQGSETRWHKTGKTRPVFAAGGRMKGFKKILVLYTNYGKQRKPQKTNWIMHQYHLGVDEEEKDGELVVSKVFYQTQPRQCTAAMKDVNVNALEGRHKTVINDEDDENDDRVDYYSPQQPLMAYSKIQGGQSQSQMLHGFPMHGGSGASFLT